MKNLLSAVAVVLAIGLAPAMAAEGNGDPFPNNAGDFTTRTASRTSGPVYADTGSNAYPTQPGRPGSDLPSLAGDVLPTNGSQGIVQTANSLPAGFENGTVAYAQANSIHAWMLAHSQPNAAAYASVARLHTPGG